MRKIVQRPFGLQCKWDHEDSMVNIIWIGFHIVSPLKSVGNFQWRKIFDPLSSMLSAAGADPGFDRGGGPRS